MQSDRCLRFVILSVAAALVSGCAGTSAPRGWLQPVEKQQRVTVGAWAKINYSRSGTTYTDRGELVAVHDDSMFYFDTDGLNAVARADVSDVRLTTYQSGHGSLALWTAFGTLSTLSHGVVLILSAPFWILTGTVVTAGASREPIAEFRSAANKWQEDSANDHWQALRKFARFPQGMPPRLNRDMLRQFTIVPS